jgi:nucleoside-diphosphate-sugar epimerase
MPVFGVFGDGEYKLQPIHVEDFAELAVREGKAEGNRVIDAIGPETFSYRGLAEEIGRIIGVRRRILRVHPRVGFAMAWCAGVVLRDVVVTWEEVLGLMGGLLETKSSAAGGTKLTEWALAGWKIPGAASVSSSTTAWKEVVAPS